VITWVDRAGGFPPVSRALTDPNGLLAASRALDADLLLDAYRHGVFPWCDEPTPLLWWSPDPRLVLHADELRVHRSLRKRIRALRGDPRYALRLDADFAATMHACAAPRQGHEGTWITAPIHAAYGELHTRRLAHAIELFDDGRAVGGLYAVTLGRMFYGESMYSREADASKIALVAMVAIMRLEQVPVIDCQQRTSHLLSLGARELPRADFCAHIARFSEMQQVDWTRYSGLNLFELLEDI
jgi:leucyl/phenylalanyl-tRNA---protein transferase